MKTDIELFEEQYLSVLQHQVFLADTQNLFFEIGRGAGKTSKMFVPRIERVTYAMPRSIVLLAGPTYTFLLDTIVPAIISGLAQNYQRGIHYEYGKQPPRHFKRPYSEVVDWHHTISLAWGTVMQFVSLDRPESSIGKNAAHIFCDELLRFPETSFIERMLPTLRGDRTIHGKSCYFGGITGGSSTPNFENDHDWWLNYEQNMNKELIEEIMYAAYRVSVAKYEAKTADTPEKVEKYTRFVEKWSGRLNEKRRGATFYAKGSSFSNLVILGLDYIKNQMSGSAGNFDKFKLSILGIRPNRVKEMFFGKFSPKNIFTDSYLYTNIDLVSADSGYKHTSRDLTHCNADRPLLIGFDPGHFMSAVVAQETKNELSVFKNFYAIHPEQHFEMAAKFNTFFSAHRNKVIYLYYDRAGNQKIYKGNPKGDTDAKILKYELEQLGWHVTLMNIGQRAIFYWEHYLLLDILLGEKEFRYPKIKICQYECEELISSIYMSPLKRTEGSIELDKRAEKTLDPHDQVFWSPQIATSLMYLLFGLYKQFLPNTIKEPSDYTGL